MEVPPGNMASRRAGDSPSADLFLCSQFPCSVSERVHPHPKPVCRSICIAQAGSSDRFDGRLAPGPLPAPGSGSAQRAHHGSDCRLGQPVELCHPRPSMDYATCWSQLQKDELVYGSDWDSQRVHIGGIPSYDGYFRKEWQLSKEDYFKLHDLDPNRKLISYACSFVHFAPNFPNVEALAKLVSSGELAEPSQLLVRLHPSHFQDKPRIFAEERERIFALEKQYPNVHVVKPVALGGSLGYYGGEDMDEKSSMMAHSDVLVTVYSTMVVETAVHDTPIVAAVIGRPGWMGSAKEVFAFT